MNHTALSWLNGKIAGLFGIGVVARTDDTTAGQQIQVRVLQNETLDVEHIQPYGLTSVPLPPSADGTGAEVVVYFIGGSRSGGVALQVGDRRYRLTGLEDGEVALYDDLGQMVHLTRTGIVIKAPLAEIGTGAVLTAANGVVTGTAFDPYTGQTQFALGNASSVVRSE